MKKITWIFSLFMAACAPGLQTEGLPEAASRNFSIDFPEQWVKVNSDKYLMLTRQSLYHQYILIQQRPVDRPFKHTKRKISKGMLPEEAAEVIIDEITSDRAILNFKVVENTPATVNQYDGFRVVFTYKNREGLEFKTIYYGFLRGDWFYNLRYNAAKNQYSDKDVQTFEKVLNSFQIENSQSAWLHHSRLL